MSESQEVYWQYLPRSRRPGFTVVEYLIGFFAVVVLVRVALPFVLEWTDRRAAWEVLAEVATLEDAVRQAAGNGDLAAISDRPIGVVPPGLDAYLPDGFVFDHGRWSIDWDLYEVEGTARDFLVGDVHGAVELRIPDRRLRAAVIREAGPRTWLVEGDRVSLLVPNLTGVEAQ